MASPFNPAPTESLSDWQAEKTAIVLAIAAHMAHSDRKPELRDKLIELRNESESAGDAAAAPIFNTLIDALSE